MVWDGNGVVMLVAALCGAALILVLLVPWLLRQRRHDRHLLLHSLESMNDGFVLYDDRDRLVMWNSHARSFYSRSARSLSPGATFETIIRLEMSDAHFALDEGEEEAWIAARLEAHREARGVEEQWLADGRCIKIAEDRTPEGYTVSLIVDITELKRAQHAAEAADRAKSELLSTISHELRTPLTVVLGHAAFLSDSDRLPQSKRLEAALDAAGAEPGLRDRVREFAEAVSQQGARIRSSSQHLLDLVNEILDLARIESGRLEVRREWLSVAEVVEDTIADFRQAAESRGILLEQEVSCDAVHADPLRLKQILYNLLGNAMKFTDSGSVRLVARSGRGGVHFAVEDTGCGIGEADLERIFESFQQIDNSDTRRHRGSGLGLALSKELAELHGGSITVESTLGEGSRFTCVIPDPVSTEAEPPVGATDLAGRISRADPVAVRSLAPEPLRQASGQ